MTEALPNLRGHDVVRPTSERIAKGGISVNPAERGAPPKAWNADEAMIDVYLRQGTITRRMWSAGDAFSRTYFTAKGSPFRGHRWEPAISGGNQQSHSDTRIAAEASLRLWATKHPPLIYACLEAVCGLQEAMTTWASRSRLHPATGRPMLETALHAHANYLRLPE